MRRLQFPKLKTLPKVALGPRLQIAFACALVFAGVVLIATLFIEREIEARVTKVVNAALETAPPNLEISYARVDVSLWRLSVSLLGVHVQSITIDRLRVGGLDWESLLKIVETRKAVLPRDIRVELDGIHLTSELLGEQAAAALQVLGYESLEASVTASISLDRFQKSFNLREFVAEAPHVGRFEAKAVITNFRLPTPEEIARLKKDPRLFLTDNNELTKATLKSFDLRYVDDSLMQRATTALIQAGEDSPESLVMLALEVNEPSERVLASTANPASLNDFTKPALETLLKFVREPRSITLASRPPQPIPFVSLLDENVSGSINDLAHRLNLSVQ